MTVGVVVSGYNMPSAVRLQLRAIKAWSGCSPALAVWDDASSLSSEVKAVCQDEGATYLGLDEKWGHAAGFLCSLYSGLHWAHEFDFLAVISQRHVITTQDWLVPLRPGFIMANPGQDWTGYRYLYTALVVLNVEAWKPHVLSVRPRRLAGIPAEAYLYDAVALVGDAEPLPSLEVVDYKTSSPYDFKRLAAHLGVTLWEDFHTDYFRDYRVYDVG